MKLLFTEGTGASQTTTNAQDEKIPVYETKTAAETDLANLEVGQIIATKDEGNELSNPVDVVQDGNMHTVTSNAVAEAFKLSPIETITLSTTNQTAQYDGVLFVYIVGTTQTEIIVNGSTIYVSQVPDSYDSTAVIPLSKGDTFRATDASSIIWCRARWYKNR